jgi:hypothetical protein
MIVTLAMGRDFNYPIVIIDLSFNIGTTPQACIRDFRHALWHAGISRGKGKIRMPERGGVGSAQPCWPPRSAVIGPASDCPSDFGADIMASYTDLYGE